MNRIRSTCCQAVFGLMLFSFGTVNVLAGTGAVISLPIPGKKARSGLIVQIDTRWLDGNGYRPVRVRVSPIPPGPARADRNIQITLGPRDWRANTKRATVTATVELAQGDRIAQETISIPHHEGWGFFDVEVREGGVKLRDLSQDDMRLTGSNHQEWSEAVPAILFIDSDAPRWPLNASQRAMPSTPAGAADTNKLPDIRSIASRLPLAHGHSHALTEKKSKAIDDQAILRLVRDMPRLEIIPPADLPDRWIDLTCVDIAFISKTDVESLSREFPKKWEALRAWLATGTVLCVTETALDAPTLAELESTLAVPPLHESDSELRGWSVPNKQDYVDDIIELKSHFTNRTFSVPLRSRSFIESQLAKTDDEEEMKEKEAKPVPPPDPQPFVWRGVGSGQLVAIRGEQPFAQDPQSWCWLLNSLSPRNWMWYKRHGVSMHRENPDYWKLLIPNVGQAPVNSFLLLISLFVVVIGPINYFLLQRSGRLYLLTVTVPAGAILITLGLLAYALLTDGLGVRARARSLTQIDQRSGRAVAWSRQTYYAGMAPAGGIAFPLDAAVYPVEFRPRDRYIPTDRRWHTLWENQQRLVAGYLPSRTTTQFLVVESRPTKARLVFETSDEGTLSVTNRLGSELLRLLVCDESGEYHSGPRLSSGGSVALQRVKPSEVAEAWNVAFARHRPNYPEGFDPYQMENAAGIFPIGRFYRNAIDTSMSKPAFASSVFESRITGFGQDFRNLQAQSYLAIVKSSPEVALGTEQAQEQASLHVVWGRW